MLVRIIYEDLYGPTGWEVNLEDKDFAFLCDKYATEGYSVTDITINDVVEDLFDVKMSEEGLKAKVKRLYDAFLDLSEEIEMTEADVSENYPFDKSLDEIVAAVCNWKHSIGGEK